MQKMEFYENYMFLLRGREIRIRAYVDKEPPLNMHGWLSLKIRLRKHPVVSSGLNQTPGISTTIIYSQKYRTCLLHSLY